MISLESLNFNLSLNDINENNFEDIALTLFHYQYKNNQLYHTYVNQIGKDTHSINNIYDIPFLPIRFFKTHSVVCGQWKPEVVFTSSATTGSMVSSHAVPNLSAYLNHTSQIFEFFYGDLTGYHFLALLPSYLERTGSSLIAMINYFISKDSSGHSGYYLTDYDALLTKVKQLKNSKKKIVVWGVSFALLDLAEKLETDLSHCLVMETGGMKGRRKEWVRNELHEFLCTRLNTSQIHSEYGMTELMSQAYSIGGGYFTCPPSMKVLVRDINDPFSWVKQGQTGVINIIDLANVHSCAFIETEDLGKVNQDFSFEVLGRLDNTDVRGCNLLLG